MRAWIGTIVVCSALSMLGCKDKQQAPQPRECERGVDGCVEKDPESLRQKLISFQNELKVDDDRLAEAGAAASAAQTDADRAAANDRVQALQKQRQELIDRIAALSRLIERAEKLKTIKITKECLDNPLAKGCS